MKSPRFNNELDGNLAWCVFKHLTRLDWCLSKAVCTDWWRLISQKPREKLEFKKDFCQTLMEYDRPEYVSAVEYWSTFSNPISMWMQRKDVERHAQKRGSIYSYMFFCRLIQANSTGYDGVWSVCKDFPRSWDTALVPVLSFNCDIFVSMFWNAVQEARIDFLDWLYQRHLIGEKNDYFRCENPLLTIEFSKENFEMFQHLYTKNYMGKMFWESFCFFLMERHRVKGGNIEALFKIIEICKVVPEGLCEKVVFKAHERFSHLCGCETELVFKKRKK